MVIWWDINYPYKAMQDTPSHWYKCISVTSKSARLMVNSENNLKIFVDIFIYIRFKSLVSQSHQRWFFPIISTRILFTESPKTLTGRSRDNSFLDVQKTLHLKRSIKERLVYFLCFSDSTFPSKHLYKIKRFKWYSTENVFKTKAFCLFVQLDISVVVRGCMKTNWFFFK